MDYSVVRSFLAFLVIFSVGCRVVIKDFNYLTDTKYLNATVIISVNKVGNPTFSANITTHRNLSTVWMKVELGTSIDGKLLPGSSFMNSKINICKSTTGIAGVFLLKEIVQKFKRFSNITLKCPILKGFYVINKYEITDDNFPKLLIQNKKYVLFVNLTGKIIGMKKLALLYTMKGVSEFE